MNTRHDMEHKLSVLSAGLLSSVVGYASSAILVFQAALHFGLSPEIASSWLSILCLAMGGMTIFFSVQQKKPVMFAWSTAGAVLLLASPSSTPIQEVYGSFLLSYVAIAIFGFSGFFEKIMNRIPASFSQAMLAGILFNFVLNAFRSVQTQASLTLFLLMLFLIFRRFLPRFNIVALALVGLGLSVIWNLIQIPQFQFQLPQYQWLTPQLSFNSLISLGIPLFLVTMTSQNMSGIATLKAHHYHIPISRVIGWTGLIGIVISCFGGFTLNLSAITASICMGPEVHPEPGKRYHAAVVSGIFYVIVGIFAGLMGQFFMALPKELISIVIGFALISTVTQSLAGVFSNKKDLEPSLMTFFITASGISLLGIGAPFWGLLGGAISWMALNLMKNENAHPPRL